MSVIKKSPIYPYNGISFFQCGKTLATLSLIRSFGPKKMLYSVRSFKARMSVGYSATISSQQSCAFKTFLKMEAQVRIKAGI